MSNIKCNICNSSNNKFLFLKDGLEIIRCRNCKAAYVYPTLSLNKVVNIYDEKSYYSELIAHDQRESEKERFPWEKILSYIETLVDNKGQLLDIGSGTGFFINLARKRGWEVCGIEPSRFAYNYSVQKYNCKIINKTLKEADLPEACFDMISLWNVLEHLNDPLDIFLDIKKIVKVNGLIAFSVPNINSFEAYLFKENWAALQPLKKGHLYYFTLYTIKYILNKTGFKIEKIFSLGGFGFRAHIFNKNINASQKRKSILVESIASIIRYILGIFKKGSILIVIARRIKDPTI